MKQRFSIQSAILFAILLFVTACHSGTSDIKDNNDLKHNFSIHLDGTWVMTDYLADLNTTKSPLTSSAKLKGVVAMTITTSIAQGDTLPVTGSLNNHEGLNFNIIFKPGQNDNQIATDLPGEGNNDNFYEIGYDATGKDTAVVLYEYSKDKKEISKRRFTKVTGTLTDDSEPYGIQYMVNKTLLSGTYNTTDDRGKTSAVTFTDDGILKGVEGHSTYYIFTDFIAEEQGYLVDELCFDEQTKTQKPFIFKINADTVRLYEAKENAERTKLEQGALKYTLVKTTSHI